METILPEFYPAFTCKADRCAHSCCKGWEIDIDKDTAARYQSMKGTLGDRLRQNMLTRDGQSCFRMDEEGKCPFLRADGLCQIIRETGEENLCVICTMHPRFFTYVGAYELAGTGLSCEKTVELLLGSSDPLRFGVMKSAEQAGKSLMDLSALLAKIGLIVPAEELQYTPAFTLDDAQFVLDCLAQTEPIDADWQQVIADLQRRLPDIIRSFQPSMVDSGRFNRIFHYILYRQLEQAAGQGTAQVLSFAYLNTDFILLSGLATGNLAEALRRWSEQIEYDPDNVALLYTLI